MNISDIPPGIVTSFSLLVALISAIASIINSKQYREAKEEQIKVKEVGFQSTINSKEEQLKTKDMLIESLNREIGSLRELNPKELRESYISMKDQLVESINNLKRELDAARKEIQRKSLQIKKLEERLKKQIHFLTDPRYQPLLNSLEDYVRASGSVAFADQAKVLKNLDEKLNNIATHTNWIVFPEDIPIIKEKYQKPDDTNINNKADKPQTVS